MKENRYSIKDLENLTHIKAHTIRIWEQRYGLLQPQRTETNIRFYRDSDLRKILNVNLLYTNGLKISKIAALSENQIIKEAKKIIDSQEKVTSEAVPALMNFILKMDETAIRDLFKETFKKDGMQKMYSDLIVPTLIRVGELWQLNTLSIAHEHFFTAILRNFIVEKLNELPVPKKGKKVILFLHAEEEHELSLLMYHYVFRSRGFMGVYLGPHMPLTDLMIAVDQEKPDYLVSNFVKYLSEEEFSDIINELNSHLKPEQLVIGGFQALEYKHVIHPKSHLITSNSSLDSIFE
jgi:DNA-binding transcriptional MerR regulator